MSDEDQIHITPDGPEKCTATERNCKYNKNGGQHYNNMDEAKAAYDKQMKEEHGSFAVKKTTAKNGSEDVNTKNIREFLTNVNDNVIPGFGTSKEKDVRDYNNNLFKHDNLNEIVENMKNEYVRLERAPHLTTDDYVDSIAKSDEVNDGAEISNSYNYIQHEFDIKTNSYTKNYYYGSVENGKLMMYTHGIDSDIEPHEPLKRNYEKVDISRDMDLNYDGDYNEYVYTYSIDDDNLEKLNNYNHKLLIKSYKNIIDDPAQPNWMVLPKQNDAVIDPKVQNDVQEASGQAYTAKNKIHRINDKILAAKNTKARLNKIRKEYLEQKEKAKEAESNYNTHKNSSKTTVRKYEKELEKQNTLRDQSLTKLKNAEKLSNRIQEFNDSLAVADKEYEDKLNVLKKHNKRLFEEDLASKYPSNDDNVRRAAAKQWLADNEDNLPNLESYHRSRSNRFEENSFLEN